MMRIWNQEKDNYLIEIHKGRSNTEIADLMNKKFKTNFSVSAINSRKRVKVEKRKKMWKKNVSGLQKKKKVFFLKTKRQFWKTAGIEAKIRTKNKGEREKCTENI